MFGPSGLTDYGSATQQILIPSFPWIGSNFAIWGIWQHYPVRVEVHPLGVRVPCVGVVADDGVAEGVSAVHA